MHGIEKMGRSLFWDFMKNILECIIIWIICEKMNINKLSKNLNFGERVPVDCHKHSLILSDAQINR